MKQRMAFLILGLIFIFISACERTSRQPSLSLVAAEFKLEDIDGKYVSLNDYKGKVIILDFWATWCPPCREEIPDFIALQNEYGKRGLQIIGISVDRDKNAVKNFYKEYGMNYPVLYSDGNVDSKYGGIRAIPTTFIIDKNGKIVKKYVGFQSKATFEKEIKESLTK